MRRLFSTFLGCSILLAFFTSAVQAQEIRASISGIIRDPSGSVVPGVTVTVTSVERNTSLSTVSEDTGNYLISFLLPGTYRLATELPGFKRFIRENILLQVGDKARIDVTLEVGEVSDSVVVEQKSQLLETETATRGHVITSQQIADLPNNGRNVFQLVWAVPGVIKASTYWGSMENYALGNATSVSINGGKVRENETLLDGTTDTVANRDVNFQPPLESVREFKVNTGTYDAQYGRTGGGVTTIHSKSGTNAFHGSVYEFNKMDALGANPWVLNYLKQPRPHFINNTFGFEVDGPVYVPKLFDGRNKVFFMVAYEGLQERSSGGDSALVPTDAMRNGDFSAVPVTIFDPLTTKTVDGRIVREAFAGNKIPANRISPVAAKVLAFVPKPNFGTGVLGEDNYAAFLGAKNYYNEWLARLDWAINANNNIYVRHGRLPYTEFDDILFGGSSPAEPSTENPLHRNFYNWSVDWTSTLNPTTILDLRAGLARYVNTGGSPPAVGFDPRKLEFADSLVSQFTFLHFPRFELGKYTTVGTSRILSKDVNDAYSYQANLSRVEGNHQLKTGVEFRLYNQNSLTPGLSSGRYVFNKVFTQRDPTRADAASGDEFAAFLLGYPISGSVDVNVDPAFQHHYYALFAQDDWKVTPRLTANLGLRWDMETAPVERFNRMHRGFAFSAAHPLAGSVPGLNLKGGILFASENDRRAFELDKNNFQPRVGMAYRLSEKWVVRGGYGLFFLGANERGSTEGFSRQTPLIASNDSGQTPRVTLTNAFPEGLLRPIGNSLGANTNTGLNIGTVFLDRPLPYSHQFSFGVERQLPGEWLVEVAYSGNQSRRLPVSANINVIPREELGKESTYYTARLPNPLQGLIPANSSLNGATISRELLLRPYPHYGAISVGSIPIGKQYYHSMQSRLTKRFNQGMSLLVAYTISKNIEAVSFLNNQDFILSDPDSSRPERRLTQFDAPQKLAVLWTAQLPFGRSRRFGSNVNPVVDKVIGGWQFNMDLTLQSGFPADYPNAPPLEKRSAKLPSDRRDLFHAFDTTLFPRTAPNLNFNLRTFPTRFSDVRLYPLQNLDASLYKNTSITESIKLQLRVEFLNAFNHPWFSRLRAPQSIDVTNPTFGYYRLEEGNQMRLVALVAKVLW
jgi:hypothetical protein